MAQRFCKTCSDWHDLDQPWPLECMKIEPDLRGPWRVHVIGDVMEPVQSQVDGRFYTSKAALRASYRPSGNAEGKQYIEVGNDAARFKPRQRTKIDRQAIRASLERAKSRVNLTS